MIAGTRLLEGSNKYCSLLDPCLLYPLAHTSSWVTVRVYVPGGGKNGGEEGDGDRVVIREEGMNIVSDPSEVTLCALCCWSDTASLCQTAAREVFFWIQKCYMCWWELFLVVVLNNTSLELLEMFSYFICRKHKVVYFNLFFNPFQPNDEKDIY